MEGAAILAQVDIARTVSSVPVRHGVGGRHGEGKLRVSGDRLTTEERCDEGG